MWLLSSLDETTSTGVAAFHMLVLGLGLGMVMQVLVLAVQNAVPYDMLGVATSGSTLFRSIGGSLGTAVLGAIFSARLRRAGRPAAPTGGLDPSAISRCRAVHDAYISAFTDALHVVFLVADGRRGGRVRAVVVHRGAAAAQDGRDERRGLPGRRRWTPTR